MVRVVCPFRVKANGVYYAPGEQFTVADAAELVALGATVIKDTAPAAEPVTIEPSEPAAPAKKRGGRAKKPN